MGRSFTILILSTQFMRGCKINLTNPHDLKVRSRTLQNLRLNSFLEVLTANIIYIALPFGIKASIIIEVYSFEYLLKQFDICQLRNEAFVIIIIKFWLLHVFCIYFSYLEKKRKFYLVAVIPIVIHSKI